MSETALETLTVVTFIITLIKQKHLTREYQKRTSNNNILIVNDYLK